MLLPLNLVLSAVVTSLHFANAIDLDVNSTGEDEVSAIRNQSIC